MLRKNPYTQKPNTRKSVRYYLTDKGPSRDLHTSLHAHMFIEDLHLGVMPIGGRSENPNFVVEMEPPSKEVEELIRLGLHTHHGEPHNITEAICDFIDEAVHILAYYGKAYYEIIYFYDDENKNKIGSFEIERIHNDNIKDTFGFYWQFLPKKILKDREQNLKRFIWLPKKDLLVLSIPKEIGGIRKFRRLLSELQWLSKCTIPEFAMKDMAVQKQTKGYDFSTYRENQETFLARITNRLGWTARGTFNERSLEFYQIYRYLKFEKTKAILREHVLHKVNKSLEIIGNNMGFKTRLRLKGMPSHRDYDNYIKQLTDGSLQFSDAVKLMRV